MSNPTRMCGTSNKRFASFKSTVSLAVPMIFVMAFFLGVFAVVFLRVAQSIADGIIGAITRWWAG